MFKDDKEFDEFLKYFSIADVDVEVQFLDNGDDWMLCSGETDEEGVLSTIDVTKPITTTPIQRSQRGRGRGCKRVTTVTAVKRTAGRTKARHVTTAKPRRRRDRRRSEGQRERENAKRKIKQEELVGNRQKCFQAECALRDHVTRTLWNHASKRGMSVEQTMHLLPPDLLHIMRSSDAAMLRYRAFTGQKHISAQLNRFPTWPEVDDVKKEFPEMPSYSSSG